MKSSVIIEAGAHLAWHQRLASEFSTAALWGGWLFLWAPLVRSLTRLAHLGLQQGVLNAMPAGGPSLPFSLAAIAGTSGTFVAWRKLPRLRARVVPALPVSEYARHFEVSEESIEAGRGASICVVHHHPDGRIASIECRAPDVQAAA